MKIWYGYGSEHSSKLVMIGRFQKVSSACAAKEAIDELTKYVTEAEKAGTANFDKYSDRYPDGLLDVLQNIGVLDVAPPELEQFNYDVSVELKHDRIILTTDESDVSAFFKVMIGKGARVEVYSRHHYPDEGRQELPTVPE